MENNEKKETKEINRMSLLIVALIVLVLVVAGAVYYIFHQHQQMEAMTATFDLEKEMLADDFNELSLQYEGYKFSVSNDSLVALLSTEQAKVHGGVADGEVNQYEGNRPLEEGAGYDA